MTAQNLVNTPDNRLVVAVDGPSGVGKSTLCRAVAKHFGAQYFDTGAMYRAATLAVLRAGVNPTERAAVIAATNHLYITRDAQSVLLDGEDVAEDIRSTLRMTPSSLTPPTCHCQKPSIRLFPSWKNQPKGAPHK